MERNHVLESLGTSFCLKGPLTVEYSGGMGGLMMWFGNSHLKIIMTWDFPTEMYKIADGKNQVYLQITAQIKEL